MKQDDEGFYYPIIENSINCIECHRCIKICPLKNAKQGAEILYNVAGFYKDEAEIRKSASGGLATAIGRKFISSGGIVYGVRYSIDYKSIEYHRCSDLSELEFLRTSKYAQARKTRIYESIEADLKRARRVLFIGMPCDVAALREFVKSENLYVIALICHGPTSLKVHKDYLEYYQNNHARAVVDFSVRYKHISWKPYFIRAEFDDGSSFVEEFHKSDYGIAFRELKRPSCSICPFKISKKGLGIQADLIIGDFHLAHSGMSQYNFWGSSQASILNCKGDELIKDIKDIFSYSEISKHQALHYNLALRKPIPTRWSRAAFARTMVKTDLHSAAILPSVRIIDSLEQSIRTIKMIIARSIKAIRPISHT